MLLPFDVRIMYLLDVNKCIHLVNGGHLLSRLLEISAIKMSLLLYFQNKINYIQSPEIHRSVTKHNTSKSLG